MTDITLLGGGIGQELIHRAGDKPTPLWSTQVMIDRPGLLAVLHGDYFAAGATVATTNTYPTHRDRLQPAGIEHRFAELLDIALREAETAREAAGGGRIAGSIGPLGASYRADLLPEHTRAVTLFREVAGVLASRADILAFETQPSLASARAAVEAGRDLGKPVWIAVTVDDEDGSRLRSGELVRDLQPILRDGAAAALVNCSAPEAVPAALDALSGLDMPRGAYANAFTQITKDFLKANPTVDALSARRDLGPEAYADHAMGWVDQGATIIGGCCETGPAHIAEIARRLRADGHTII